MWVLVLLLSCIHIAHLKVENLFWMRGEVRLVLGLAEVYEELGSWFLVELCLIS